MGAVPGGHGQYLMPHYMLPAYEHSLLVDGCRLATARPAGSAEALSPYDGSAMPPNVQMPDDPVWMFHFTTTVRLIDCSL